jgi:hypothetical protein
VGQTLVSIGPYWRTRIRSVYRHMGAVFKPLNQNRRALLSEAIFAIENNLEHRRGDHPQVVAMRSARNALYDDLGWNRHQSANNCSTVPIAMNKCRGSSANGSKPYRR